MSVQIKLDSNAINTLFPEGSEARVNLQQAVVQNIVDRAFFKLNNEQIQKMVDDSIREIKVPDVGLMVREQLEALMSRKGYGDYEPSVQLVKRVTEMAHKVTESHVNETIAPLIEVANKKVDTKVKDRLDYMTYYAQNKIANEAEPIIVKILNDKFEEFITAAIKQRMGL